MKLPDLANGQEWLNSFADRHGVSRNDALGLWQRGSIHGQKFGKGQRTSIALGPQGKREAWAQFKIMPNFHTCDDCPHSSQGEENG